MQRDPWLLLLLVGPAVGAVVAAWSPALAWYRRRRLERLRAQGRAAFFRAWGLR